MAEMSKEALFNNAEIVGVPDYMQEGLIAYILQGRPVGHFLTAVISNDLSEAVSRADEVNQFALARYVIFLHNHAPAVCWGSKSKMQKWMKHRGLEGYEEAIKAERSESESV